MKLILAILFTAFAASAQVPQQVVNDWMLMANAARSTAWSPTQIAGLVRWYDAQSIVGLNNGDAVASWTDKAGTTNLTQAEASMRPIYIASAAELGNKPCIYFNAKELTNSSTADTTLTMFAVIFRTNTTSVGPMISMKYSSSGNSIIRNTNSAPWFYSSAYTPCAEGSAQASGVVVVRYNGGNNADIRSQSGAWANFTANGEYDDAGFIFGLGRRASSSGEGFAAELLFYDSALTDANINLVGNYLAGRWNFTWTDL